MIIEDALAALDRFGHVEIERRKPSNTAPLPWTVTIWDYPSGRGTGNNLPEAIEDALRDFEEAERGLIVDAARLARTSYLIDEAMADVEIVVCPTCKGDRILRRAFGIACPTCGAKGLSTTNKEAHGPPD